MKKRMYRIFGVWNNEKEAAWLNQKAQQGWLLENKGLFYYDFVEAEPDRYQIEKDMLTDSVKKPEVRSYLEFLEETGIDVIFHDAGWVYLKKENDGRPFALKGDLDSKIDFLKKLSNRLTPILFLQVIVMNIGIVGRNTTFSVLFRILGILAIILALTLVYALMQINRQRRELEKERVLRE